MRMIEDLGLVRPTEKSNYKKHYGIYECPNCLKHIRVSCATVENRSSTQCRSCARTKHGLTSHPLYTGWQGMKSRCCNPNNDSYKYYGGRGISVCEDFYDFDTYRKYVESLPDYDKKFTDDYTCDRIDNDGNYDYENLKWSSKTEQVLNRKTHCIPINNKSGTIGVHYISRDKVWIAVDNTRGKRTTIGRFKHLSDAVSAKENYGNREY